ncbi:MAG: hypothetical protein DLM66_09985 [Candidatus Dormiibacter spiritus]|nr:MAG: hypothetical protein DLM66_09985 [Candidatus Dormibacteraeota bacterium]
MAVGLLSVLAADGRAIGGPSSSGSDASGQVSAASPLPGIGTTTESCRASSAGSTPTTLGRCARWAKSGPINVVILSNGAETPFQDAVTETSPRWKPALGGWLVARVPTRGCGANWQGSEQQIELRINAVTRRHFKFIPPGCHWKGQWLTLGEAHTDVYDVGRCGGDRMTDLDAARDALLTSLVAGAVVSHFEYRRWSAPGSAFPDGCGGQTTSDGRVAYVWLQG